MAEFVLGVAAARDEEGAKRYGERAIRARGCASNFFDVRAKDGDGDRVFEDEWFRVVELVGRSAHGYAEGCA